MLRLFFASLPPEPEPAHRLPGPLSMSQRWASPMDWAGRRDVITRLYMDQQLPLPRVMEVMEREYGFHATYVTCHLHPQAVPAR